MGGLGLISADAVGAQLGGGVELDEAQREEIDAMMGR